MSTGTLVALAATPADAGRKNPPAAERIANQQRHQRESHNRLPRRLNRNVRLMAKTLSADGLTPDGELVVDAAREMIREFTVVIPHQSARRYGHVRGEIRRRLRAAPIPRSVKAEYGRLVAEAERLGLTLTGAEANGRHNPGEHALSMTFKGVDRADPTRSYEYVVELSYPTEAGPGARLRYLSLARRTFRAVPGERPELFATTYSSYWFRPGHLSRNTNTVTWSEARGGLEAESEQATLDPVSGAVLSATVGHPF